VAEKREKGGGRQEKANGTHIQGLENSSTSSSDHLLDALRQTPPPPDGSQVFSLGWGGKKSFVIWQRFCDYGKDHCKTFSKLVHINDFHSL